MASPTHRCVMPCAEKVAVRKWIPPPLSLREAKRGSNLPSGQCIGSPARGGLRRRFASRNDRYLAQRAAREALIRAPGISRGGRPAAAPAGRPPRSRLAARNAQSAPSFTELRAWSEKTRAPISDNNDMVGTVRYPEGRLTVCVAAGDSGCLQRCATALRPRAGAFAVRSDSGSMPAPSGRHHRQASSATPERPSRMYSLSKPRHPPSMRYWPRWCSR
jgi:hypothetical protein